MAGVQERTFDSPDETRTPAKSKVELVKMASGTIARLTFQPGWRWSECIKPVAGTDSCEAHHVGVVTSGRIRVEHQDGTAGEVGSGGVYEILPGHDAWVVGDEPFVSIEFDSSTAESYAK